ncbi:PDDEXK nuclease domain-containing protein [Aequorivita capsosiphonis]|uniref:PDDEXK nuclease domain-containing protein n=1 Tax=Aequorivita capsosiphonis TaxID=487317 RepID=UPI00047AA4C5|nr:PDDEXK nuclease domain-containing protein [Aequorivita capsosiphonis]
MTNKPANIKFYSQIVDLLQSARSQVVRTVNQTMVRTYFEIGKMLVEEEQGGEERAEYGKELLKGLSKVLTREFGKGFSVDNLENMRRFYLAYGKSSTLLSKSEPKEKRQTLSDISEKSETLSRISSKANSETTSREFTKSKFILSWSHYLKLMRIDDENERKFYEIESQKNNWSVRELQRQFDSALYTRLVLSRNKDKVKELSEKGLILEQPRDAIKDPYILEFLGLPEYSQYSESQLEQEIIDKLEHFLLELGNGFTFVARQKRISFDESHFRIDLVFYNRILKCFVLIDLKIGELKHQDLGQMQMYVNYYDREIKLEEENKTIGIVLCKDKSESVVKYTLPEKNEHIFASKYKTVLPSKAELKLIINHQKD